MIPINQLQLLRYPISVSSNLQAWDAADEYLLAFVSEQYSESNHLCVLNDSFGALTCALSTRQITSINDSYISHCAIQNNLKHNSICLPENVSLLSCNATWPKEIDMVLIKIPKLLSLLEFQLHKLRTLPLNTQIIAAGKTQHIHNSTLKLFEKYLGPTTTSLAKKKSRLIFSEVTQKNLIYALPQTSWPLDKTHFMISNQANVFSRESLDIGGRFLIENLPQGSFESVIDLGCGNGVVGLMALLKYPNAHVSFYDESFMAVDSAKQNVQHNMPEAMVRCNFQVDDCLTKQANDSCDLVLCNPPFHQQQAVTDHIAKQMFKDAKRVLKNDGQCLIVGNRHLGYHKLLKQYFGNATLVNSNRKFVVLSSTN
ncbi:MAG: 23S rRNA (guanine(1835)-N(2))-methyltransferase [Gammaproteobacteria bacterium CG22_combo_CG10-13_8_21_14_all_40_8]|nr:MAG: 23S rRNA (guanine(1835)-N(2))-methyltransferase [Gammaproteobacteria bacterium CG22_combo_CG10-13_8_21_14_all_40_8]